MASEYHRAKKRQSAIISSLEAIKQSAEKVCKKVEDQHSLGEEGKNEAVRRLKESKAKLHRKIIELDDVFEVISAKTPASIDYKTEYLVHDEESEALCVALARVETLITRLLSCNATASPETAGVVAPPSAPTATFRLPKIEIRRFGGNPRHWAEFWDQYSKCVHENKQLTDVAKMVHLRSLLSGTALNAISSLTLSDGSYPLAINLLQRRFGNSQIAAHDHLQRLSTLQPVRTLDDIVSCRRLLDFILCNRSALDNLGIPRSSYSMSLYASLVKAIPPDVIMNAERNCTRTEMINDRDSVSSVIVTDEVELQCEKLLESFGSEVESRERFALVKGLAGASLGKASRDVMQSKHQGVRSLGPLQGERSASRYNERFTSCNFKSDVSLYVECIFCKNHHESKKCTKILRDNERVDIVRRAGLCFRCLRNNHRSKECRDRNIRCSKCNGNHLTVMHNNDVTPRGSVGNDTLSSQVRSSVQSAAPNVTIVAKNVSIPKVMLQTASGIVVNGDVSKKVRILFDSGSQLTFVTKNLAHALNLPVVDTIDIDVYPFGTTNPLSKRCDVVNLSIKSKLCPNDVICIRALAIDELGCTVEASPNSQLFNELRKRNIMLADEWVSQTSTKDKPDIEILVGADFCNVFETGKSVKLTEQLVAKETKLDWTVLGPVESVSSICRSVVVRKVSVLSVNSPARDIDDLWKLESIGIETPSSSSSNKQSLTKVDQFAVDHFNSTVERTSEGRYEIQLPWIESQDELDNNLCKASSIAKSVARRLDKDKQIERYETELDRYVVENHAEPVQVLDSGKYFMPHHAIVREDKNTTKVRVVFNCSSASKGKKSLNDCLAAGPNLNSDLTGLLMRFRLHPIALVADIRQAFLQILVSPHDRDFLCYVWHRNGVLESNRMKVLPFGLTCSPFLLSSVIKRHVADYRDSHPEAFAALNECLYVDDLLVGADNETAADQLHTECTNIMKHAGMELTKWNSNSATLRKQFGVDDENSGAQKGVFKVLGVSWDVHSDRLDMCASIEPSLLEVVPTKRIVLKITASVFDPLGILSPFLLFAKVLLQRLWIENYGWDDPLNDELLVEWNQWRNDLCNLSSVNVPRYVASGLDRSTLSMQLHLFCDASAKSYAAVAYLRCVDDLGNVSVQLLMSKNRIAPKETMTIPKLELMGAVLAARLKQHICSVTNLPVDIPVYYWTDSMISLCWITGGSSQWQTFVANRVTEIREKTNPEMWRHCPGSDNPADIPTRGMTLAQMHDAGKWWNGPDWLSRESSSWPSTTVSQIPASLRDVVLIEQKRSVSIGVVTAKEPIIDLSRFSSFPKLVRTVASLFRFLYNCCHPSEKHIGAFSNSELERAKFALYKIAQQQCFGRELETVSSGDSLPANSPLNNFSLYVGTHGLLQIRTRLQNALLSLSEKEPIVLPAHHPVVDLLIMFEHRRLAHSGVTTLLSHLRAEFWIMRGRQQIKRVINSCMFCRKFRALPGAQEVGTLPFERVQGTHAFDTIGIDFAGPLFVKSAKDMQKTYICLITCAVSRAVHLELVSSLSTGCFLDAFRRFVSRRGIPSVVYSDNALTFQRANLDLQKLWKSIRGKEAREFFSAHSIEWRFIMPRSPWWGGFYERLVRTVKECLRKVLGRTRVDFEYLATILCEVEAIVNSRPLTQVSDDVNEEPALTPAHLLIGGRLTLLPSGRMRSEVPTSSATSIRQGCEFRSQLVAEFWRRWKSEYLLQLRSAHTRPAVNELVPRVGDVVLVHEENRAKWHWKMGRVLKHIIGRDSKVRGVVLRIPNGSELRRSVQLVYPLEVDI